MVFRKIFSIKLENHILDLKKKITKKIQVWDLEFLLAEHLLERNYARVTCRNSLTRNGAEVIIKWKNKDLKGF